MILESGYQKRKELLTWSMFYFMKVTLLNPPVVEQYQANLLIQSLIPGQEQKVRKGVWSTAPLTPPEEKSDRKFDRIKEERDPNKPKVVNWIRKIVPRAESRCTDA